MGKINVCDKIMIENQKETKYGNQRNLHKSPSKQADAKESADIIYLRPVCDAYR